MVFQRFNPSPHLTALDNAMVAPRRVRPIDKREAREQAAALLEEMGLRDRIHNNPHELSGGPQQRVATAQALAGRPKATQIFSRPEQERTARFLRAVPEPEPTS